MNSIRPGQLAEESNVNVETLRYYEREGLLPVPPRSGGGYRQYPPDAVDRVLFIKRAQELGFTLKEIRELLEIGSQPAGSCAEVKKLADCKIMEIEKKIADLNAIRRVLKELTDKCPATGPTDECPILNVVQQQRQTRLSAGSKRKFEKQSEKRKPRS